MSKKTTATTLDQDFRKIVLDFCKRNNMTPEQIGNKAGYTNRDRITDCFTYKKAMINAKTQNRFVDVMRTIEPNFMVQVVCFELDSEKQEG
jgi:hypothetical protein